MTENTNNNITSLSNSEIVDELTQDLEDIDIETNKDETETSKDNNPLNDFIDEDKLKETDNLLSEEEKETRKREAENLKQQGNKEFKLENYTESVNIYTSALMLCPLQYTNERSILYSNRAACKIKLDYKKSALDDCTKALELNPDYLKALSRRAKLYEETEKLDESLEDYKKIETLDPTNQEIIHNIYVLRQKIEKRNEEMKTEMLGKLKDLGNLILKPFGLSTENFQLNQDPNSGGYSVNFVQKK